MENGMHFYISPEPARSILVDGEMKMRGDIVASAKEHMSTYQSVLRMALEQKENEITDPYLRVVYTMGNVVGYTSVCESERQRPLIRKNFIDVDVLIDNLSQIQILIGQNGEKHYPHPGEMVGAGIKGKLIKHSHDFVANINEVLTAINNPQAESYFLNGLTDAILPFVVRADENA